MKHLKEKDLSLDKQEVSALGSSNGMKEVTDGCTVQTTLDSHEELCCAISDDKDTCGDACKVTYSEVEDTCVISDDPDTTCLIPTGETKIC